MKQNREDTRKMVGQESHSYQKSAKQDYKGHLKKCNTQKSMQVGQRGFPKRLP